MFNFFFFSKMVRLRDNVEEYGKNQTGDRWQYNTAHTLCILDN
jgi:hypothetical protein